MKENGIMQTEQSTVPGLGHLPIRGSILKTQHGYIEGRKKVDGAEGLWRIKDNLYDLQKFAKTHPGGEEWIRLTKGTDITEVFESHHLTDKAEQILPKYFVRNAVTPRRCPITFKPDGFYHTFRKRALEALKDVDFHKPSWKSMFIADALAITTLALCLAAAATYSYTAIFFAGLFITWTTIAGHNYFHMRDNFRMYYFDICLMSSKDWRISHAMSHHTYPNTLWDFEIYTAEPFINYLPYKHKTAIVSIISLAFLPVFWSVLFFDQAVKRYYSVFFLYRKFEFRDAVPFFLPLAMTFFAPSFLAAFKLWLVIIMVASFIFALIGFTAAHHHPEIFHDGDVCRDDLDWGLLELDAVRERRIIDDSDFLVLTNFGQHSIHHLLPTVDHCYLPLCQKAFDQTCEEFGVRMEKLTSWELAKGQFRQIANNQPRKNYRSMAK